MERHLSEWIFKMEKWDDKSWFSKQINFQYKRLSKVGFILEIIDGRELPEYMTMNKGKICG